jgi:hypothetical protein
MAGQQPLELLIKVRILVPEPVREPTMKLDKGCSLFFATKIHSKLREGLALSKPGDKKYFDGSSDEFLRVVEVEEERWIGKVIKGGTPVTEVDDIQRNVVSILRRIAPNARVPASSVKIFVLQGGHAIAQPGVEDDGGTGEDDAEAPSSGPYIAY